MMETASARDQVVEEDLSDQEEVKILYYFNRGQLKTVGLYAPQHVWLWVVEEGNLNKASKNTVNMLAHSTMLL